MSQVNDVNNFRVSVLCILATLVTGIFGLYSGGWEFIESIYKNDHGLFLKTGFVIFMLFMALGFYTHIEMLFKYNERDATKGMFYGLLIFILMLAINSLIREFLFQNLFIALTFVLIILHDIWYMMKMT